MFLVQSKVCDFFLSSFARDSVVSFKVRVRFRIAILGQLLVCSGRCLQDLRYKSMLVIHLCLGNMLRSVIYGKVCCLAQSGMYDVHCFMRIGLHS